MSDHIPADILMEILSRFPVKALVRLTLVCKLWYATITSPAFVSTHLNRLSKRNVDQLLLQFYNRFDDKVQYILIPDGEKLDENHTELAFPSEISSRQIDILGSCSGMICLRDGPKHVIIWNPSLRKSVTVTLPDKPQEDIWPVLGFGYVSEKSEYKLVTITYNRFYTNHKECNIVPLEVEVYEQGEEHWRVIECVPPLYCEALFHSQVFLHDAVHWLAYDTTVDIFHNWVVAFDMHNEVFRYIVLPNNFANKHPYDLSVTVFRNSIAVLETKKLKNSRELFLWEMRDYGVFESWSKSHNIILPGDFIDAPLGIRKDGESLYLTKRDALILYDSEAKVITRQTSFPRNLLLNNVQYYKESLVLLK